MALEQVTAEGEAGSARCFVARLPFVHGASSPRSPRGTGAGWADWGIRPAGRRWSPSGTGMISAAFVWVGFAFCRPRWTAGTVMAQLPGQARLSDRPIGAATRLLVLVV